MANFSAFELTFGSRSTTYFTGDGSLFVVVETVVVTGQPFHDFSLIYFDHIRFHSGRVYGHSRKCGRILQLSVKFQGQM